MRTQHLTRRGASYVFQIRVPRALDPDSFLAPIRVTLGPVAPRKARLAAAMLGAAAEAGFEWMQADPEMTRDCGALKAGAEHLSARLNSVLQMLRGMDTIEPGALPDSIQRPATDAILDALVGLGAAQDRGDPLLSRSGVDHAAPYLAALRSEEVARAMIGAPKPLTFGASSGSRQDVGSDLAAMRESLANLTETVGKLTAASQPQFRGPLFSAAADVYIGKLRSAHGDDHEEVAYYSHRKTVFIALCGDRPVNAYTLDDLQHFVNELAWLPPNITKARHRDIRNAKRFIADNRKRGGRGLSQKTIKDSYLCRVKTILRSGCRSAHVPFLAGDGRIIMPRRAAPSRRRPTIDRTALGQIIETGVASGMLLEAMLPVLGILSGRRLALLVTMRRENIVERDGVWIVIPQSHVEIGGRWVSVPYKTTESLEAFVLPRVLEECGFIAWAKSRPGFVFETTMRARDPADAAQKRMSRLFRAAGLDPTSAATFHCLRHTKIANDRAARLPTHLIRAQVGHEPGDVHEAYARDLTPEDRQQLRDAPLPASVDWEILKTIDFEAFARRRPRSGRRVIPGLAGSDRRKGKRAAAPPP